MPLRTRPKFPTPLITLYGINGVGKSSVAASIPNCLFVATENIGDHLYQPDGSPVLATERHTRTETVVQDLDAVLKDRAYEGHKINAVCLDSLHGLWQVAANEIVQANQGVPIAAIQGGFGRGEGLVFERFSRVFRKLMDLRDAGTLVVATCAATPIKFKNPAGEDWLKFGLDLWDLAFKLVMTHSDEVGFAHRPYATRTVGEGFHEKTIGAGGVGEPVVSWQESAACWAKYRMMPPKTPLSWAEIKKHIWPEAAKEVQS